MSSLRNPSKLLSRLVRTAVLQRSGGRRMVLPSHHRLSQPPSAPLSLYSSRMRSLVSIPALTEGTREIADKLLSPGTDPLLRRHALSRAVTLLESTAPHKADQAEGLLALLLRERAAESERCLRIGIAGPPGSGKSTLIEALGRYLLDPASAPASSTSDGHASKIWFPQHLAILCIDPSSHRTGGSILGDKTRMTHLAVHPRAFVRPTPSAGHLGGLAAATDQVIRLYGAAGYDLTLIETVGLGQSEVEVAESVDLTILLVPPAGGDGLQGVKKGILEIADVVVVTKADDDLMPAAQRTAADYQGALQFVGCRGERPPPVLLASSRTGSGLEKLWETVWELRNQRQSSGVLEERRRQQRHYWMWKSLQMLVELKTRSDPALAAVADELKIELDRGHLSPRLAATELLRVLSEQS